MARRAEPAGGKRAAVSARTLAAQAVTAVMTQGNSLADLLPNLWQPLPDARERALAQELCFGVLRWYPALAALAQQLMTRPLRERDSDMHALLLVGLYQLRALSLPAHAAVNETVRGAELLGKPWATAVINGVLRNYQRRQTELEAAIADDPAARFAHPPWLLQRLRADWPDVWQAIAQANNERPPMMLRVNARRQDRDSYQSELQALGIESIPHPHAPLALQLTQPVAVDELPGFKDGRVSVQDAAAQLAAPLLAAQAGMRVLDACAAPGGKTAHILELAAAPIAVTALDADAARMRRLADNLARIDLQANCVVGDAGTPSQWWDGVPFQRILLDAPCTASGVIRRHPDIKWLRRDHDVDELAERQQQLLDSLWPLLAPGGMLLYATCSVFAQENRVQVRTFLSGHPDAQARGPAVQWGRISGDGRQILPGEDAMDGFYYACLSKS